MFLVRSSASGLVLLLMTVITVSGQSNEISERVRRVFAGSAEQELATQRLENREFALLAEMLERRVPFPNADRAELIALEGSLAFLAGRMRDAITDFGKAAQLSPLKDGDSFTFAMALVNLGDDQRAADLLSALAAKYSKRPLYVYWLGRIEYDLRRYPEAISKLQLAIELDPTSVRGWDSLGLAFDMGGQAEQALQAFQKAVDLNREMPHPSAWPPHNLGTWYLRMNRLKEAERALQESIRYAPKLAAAHYHLGRAFDKDGQEGQAIAEFQNAIAQDGSSPESCYSLAMLYRRLHRDKEATALFTEYRRRKEANPAAGLAMPMEPQ